MFIYALLLASTAAGPLDHGSAIRPVSVFPVGEAAAPAAKVQAVGGNAGAAPENELRCKIDDDAPLVAMNQASLPNFVTSVANEIAPDRGKRLPDLMVDGWTPTPGPLGVLLNELGAAAGVKVSGAERFSTPVRWSRAKATLPDALDDLTSQAGATWTFDGQTVSISPKQRLVHATADLPADRDVALATIDLVRRHVPEVDVHGGAIGFRGSEAIAAKVRDSVAGTRQIEVFDVSVLEGRPSEGRYNWLSLGPKAATVDGAGGRFLFDNGAVSDVLTKLEAGGDLKIVMRQTVSTVKGTPVSVDGRVCGASVSAVLKPVETKDGSSLQVAAPGLDAQISGLQPGQTSLIASPTPSNGWIRMMVVRPRLVFVR